MNKNFDRLLRFLVTLGNLMLVLWVSYNAVGEGFRGTIYQKITYAVLVILLALNTLLLYSKH